MADVGDVLVDLCLNSSEAVDDLVVDLFQVRRVFVVDLGRLLDDLGLEGPGLLQNGRQHSVDVIESGAALRLDVFFDSRYALCEFCERRLFRLSLLLLFFHGSSMSFDRGCRS